MHTVESVGNAIARWFSNRRQRHIEEQRALVEHSLFALYAGINPAELGVYPDELFPPLPNPVIDCIINPQGAFLVGDTATLVEARDRLLGLINPELRIITNCKALQAAAGILADQLRDRSNPLSKVSEDFTRAAITRQLFIKGELDRLRLPNQAITS